MSHTAIEVDHALVACGQSQTGRPVQPWVMDAYAPGAAAVSTTGDLAKLATALLDGIAPGMASLEPTTATDQWNTRIGDFRPTSTWGTGQTITHHAGQTGGYASYLGLDRPRHKAVFVLSDVANDTSDIGTRFLAHRKQNGQRHRHHRITTSPQPHQMEPMNGSATEKAPLGDRVPSTQ